MREIEKRLQKMEQRQRAKPSRFGPHFWERWDAIQSGAVTIEPWKMDRIMAILDLARKRRDAELGR